MDGHTFDELIRRLGTTRLTRVRALRGIVAAATAAVTGTSLGLDVMEAKKKAKAGRKQGGKTAKDTLASSQSKVTMCHKGKTITVDESAVPARLRRGDTLGPCEAPPPICAGECSRKNPCGPGCVCLNIGGGTRRCLAQGPCSGLGDCGSGTCGSGCTCVNPGGRKSGCVSVAGCPAGSCSGDSCGPGCSCVGVGAASRCASVVIAS
jgi:hypothetical protein